MDKIAWTLVRPGGMGLAAFRVVLHQDLPPLLTVLVPSLVDAVVTVQEPDHYGSALLRGQSVDALLEITTSVVSPPLDAVNHLLAAHTSEMQGWRVHPTVIYETGRHRPLGEPSAEFSNVVFVQRTDGSTPEHFSRNWYIHAGHLDGEEAESPQSIAERDKDVAAGFCRSYVQNRMLEPITPVDWVVDGYTQLRFAVPLPAYPDLAYERVRGEAEFDRWPPRVLQGHELRVL